MEDGSPLPCPSPRFNLGRAIVGCWLGTAIGLPREGLSKRRLHRLYSHLDNPHFFSGKGMASDDTEHACMVAQSLKVSAGDARYGCSARVDIVGGWLERERGNRPGFHCDARIPQRRKLP